MLRGQFDSGRELHKQDSNMSKVKCNKCKDRGYVEYKKIDDLCHYHWIPYKKRACDCCEAGQKWAIGNRD